MATYTSSTASARRVGGTIWLSIVTLVAASALVLALFALQQGGLDQGATINPPPVILQTPHGPTQSPWTVVKRPEF